ncbi:hypothetical protein FBY40_2826 [Microbacterium sp. SLBN-154]|uniref:hypothetical protein n=1 Tax=Microbacterium sp. SLBN-154 TaxID=2768458 RepID=UPI00114EFD91|nr:hypothetical protein [Microbacterium sp. SLBN-154]TQK20297.1 hypothetical protein FBY40_2826 [Microbacterium sp. SLBN-154]
MEVVHVVSLVVNLPIAKPDALAVIALVSDGEVQDAGSADPRVWVSAKSWAMVDLPRFAEPPPFAVDVCSDEAAAAREDARRLAMALERVGWRIEPFVDPPAE